MQFDTPYSAAFEMRSVTNFFDGAEVLCFPSFAFHIFLTEVKCGSVKCY